MKRGWTRFSLSASALLLLWSPARAQLRGSLSKAEATSNSVSPHGFAELTLAGLRPGRDAIGKAQRLFQKPEAITDNGTAQTWQDTCRNEALSVIADPSGSILEVRVTYAALESKRNCANAARNHWTTGHGLILGDSCSRAVALYGQPNSRGPSTKSGQQLELLYYAFDWAGPDVPQVMEVLCTPGKDSQPGRIVEITLAAPSL